MTLRWKRRLLFISSLALSSFFAARWLEARVAEAASERALIWTRGLYETALLTRLSLPEADSVETMTLNGASVRLSTVHSQGDALDTNMILDQARIDCSTAHKNPQNSEALVDSPFLLSKNKSEGALFCLKPKEPLDAAGLERAWTDFAETGDFSSWGTFHAVYTRSEGRHVRTFTVEILDGFSPADMFPEGGDAPGGDIQHLPRPSGKRILSLSHRGTVALTGYRTKRPVAEALKEYEQKLDEAQLQTWRHPNAPHSAFVRSREESFLVTIQPIGEESVLLAVRLPD